MELDRGAKLGAYEILSPIAEGATCEVYRALDTLLDREVAIKLLPGSLAENPAEWRRIEGDARAISQLHHPNIRTIFDVRRYKRFGFLVMEWLEGETLSARLGRDGPLPDEELLAIAIQIAEALGEAHRQGIIHGNLTPEHVFLAADGAKLLTFSAARNPAFSFGHPPASPMIDEQPVSGAETDALRHAAPEQIEGEPADARSDIFSFGTLLYEMATGRPAFPGRSAARVSAAIREAEPTPIALVQPSAPPLDPVVSACLAKEPEERLQSAHDLQLQLEWVRDGFTASGSASAKRIRNRERVAWLVAAAAVAVAAAMVAASLLRHEAAARLPRVRAEIELPGGLTLGRTNDSLAVSPEGDKLVVAANDANGKRQLWLRFADEPTFRALSGTTGATFPFWSPNGSSIGFFADGQLKRINLATGDTFTICAAPDGRGASWSREGTIVFAPLPYGGLYSVSASGGEAVRVSVPEKASMSERLPHFLPGGRGLLFYSGEPGPSKTNGIYTLNLASGKSRLLLRAESEGRYLAPGYLAFVRDGNLMIQRFLMSRLALSGQPLPIARGVAYNSRTATAEFTFSRRGMLVYQPAAPPPLARLTWLSLDGKEVGATGKPARFVSATVLPGGREALARTDDGKGDSLLWIYDLETGQRRRFDPTASSSLEPLWAPDGRQMAVEDGRGNLFLKTVRESGASRKILSRQGSWMPSGWSADGRLIALDTLDSSGWDIWILPTGAGQGPYAFLRSQHNEYDARFSADGHWLSYISDASGRGELYVVSYPQRGKSRMVSSGGAISGGWVPGLSELAYITPQGRLVIMKARTRGGKLYFGKPAIVLSGRPLPATELTPGPHGASANFFSPNGKRVLLPVPVERKGSGKLTLLTEWKAAKAKL